jgi:RHS repeat-associated protein
MWSGDGGSDGASGVPGKAVRPSAPGAAGREATPSERGSDPPFAVTAPAITLPKGGGAIRGIGEKFGANPVTGTGSLSVPIATSPGRGGFGPALLLAYDSGAGNGPFGFGWHLSLPSITRKTDKGLPRYRDGVDDSDVFILSGAEDLVPELKRNADGTYLRNSDGTYARDEVPRDGYLVRRYRPRIEGLFARIERWRNPNDPTDTYWLSISRDNVTTVYGKSPDGKAATDGRISDPADSSRIFSWPISESYDDKGNWIVYGYKPEDSRGVDAGLANERNRTRGANRYLAFIRYGNKESRLSRADPSKTTWLFEVVFDYGEHDKDNPTPADSSDWICRLDPFSSYRAGFEVRSYRLCQRVLMFHHFLDEPGVGDDCLVRSTDFVYRDDPQHGGPLGAFIAAVTQKGYQRTADGRAYLPAAELPPLEFDYTEAKIQEQIREVDPTSLENLPVGLDGAGTQWVDLDGEGISGILSEQATGWFYKRNTSPLSRAVEDGIARDVATFAPLELIAERPAFAATGAGGWQFHDLAGNGRPDLVRFEGPPTGFFERNDDGWDDFVSFRALPNVSFRDPNLRFVDLTGDGLADILITEDQAFTWYESRGKTGFAASKRTMQALDEERGPRLVFADAEQTIYLADLSGDGLTDLVRIRNGEICYWPNLGYGCFGAKVTMDGAPWFDAPDQFSQRRIRLADVDGSGTTDLIYLGRDGVCVYFNQSGNGWSAAQIIQQVPAVDDLTAVQVVDLFGNGTACLVWSSPLPGDARRPMRYIDLMGGQKPHLLVTTRNNLGGETRVEYAASTRFYLADKAAGTPWITKLPFPVHVVEKVTVTDAWRQTTFTNTYSYHHGYFDGVEREFRGFGRVEQVDVESYGRFAGLNAKSPYVVTDDPTLYQPPVKTITWFHTGAALDRQRILSQFAHEYFPQSLAALPANVTLDGAFAEKSLPEPDLRSDHLNADEWREALRACKGMTLRQEVYELDVDALERTGAQIPVRLYSAATHNCAIRLLQPRGENPHAVFLVTESEALSYQYDLALPGPSATPAPAIQLAPDPRVGHTLNLSFDDFGNVQQSIAVGYPRLRAYGAAGGPANYLVTDAERVKLIQRVQSELHLAYTETHYTSDLIDDDESLSPPPKPYHRLPQAYEVQTYELTGITPYQAPYFALSDLQRYVLSERYSAQPTPGQTVSPVGRLAYHQILPDGLPTGNPPPGPQMRLVELARTLFFRDDLGGARPLGNLGPLGLPYEHYKLALTKTLLADVLTDPRLASSAHDGTSVLAKLQDPSASGYTDGAYFASLGPPDPSGPNPPLPPVDPTVLATPAPPPNPGDEYWMRSGVAGFAPDAPTHFFLPERYTDAFGNVTTLEHDTTYYLSVKSSTDAMKNTVSVLEFDYRVLAPRRMQDANLNRSEAWFDVLGRVAALALNGKVTGSGVTATTEADSLQGYDDALANPPGLAVAAFFASPASDPAHDPARTFLGNATTRFLYHFGETRDASDNVVSWADRPAGACAIARERHVGDLAAATTGSPLQLAFECSDGHGGVLMKRSQAEPAVTGGPLRWIVSGKTILNNKGKPVKQYEPYFSANASCSGEGYAAEEVGVTPLLFYDAAGRLIRTEMPDGTFSRVELSPWQVLHFDANDTVLDSRWYQDRGAPDPASALSASATPETRAAWLATHHANTPALTIVDSLGREVIAVAHNRYVDTDGTARDEKYLTFTKLDAEGKPLWICDARGNLVMQYITPPKPNHTAFYDATPDYRPAYEVPVGAVPCYDIAGNLLFQHSMDAADRWVLSDAAGKPMFAWDLNDFEDGVGSAAAVTSEARLYQTEYDPLHRPIEQWLSVNGAAAVLVEAFEHCDTATFSDASGAVTDAAGLSAAQQKNLVGQTTKHWDSSGLATVERVDLAGAVSEVTRTLVKDVASALVDWNGDRAALLEVETFRQITLHDALGRMTTLFNWHLDDGGAGTSSRVAVYVPAYNARGALQAETLYVRASKTTTADGKPRADTSSSRQAKAITNITYDAKGQKLTLELGNGTTTRYAYDPNTFRLIRLYTRRDPTGFGGDCASGSADTRPCGVQNLRYTYDPVGNITHIQDDAQQTIYFSGAAVEPNNDYVYDAIYRLIAGTGRENGAALGAPDHAEGPWPTGPVPSPNALRTYTQSYGYDSVGNILQMKHVAPGVAGNSGSFTRYYGVADDSNRLLHTWYGAADMGAGSDRTDYRYDPHGNMLNLASTAAGLDLRWDRRDMIRSLDLQGGGWAYYNYGSDKQRTRKRLVRNGAGGTVEDRIYLGGFELYRRYTGGAASGTPVETIESLHLFEGEQRVLLVDDVIAAGGSRPDGLTVTAQTLWRYQYGNHLGSVGLELDAAAAVISHEEFHPYGTSAYRLMETAAEAPPKRYRYTGMERDEESGLSYHAARYYAPSCARWLSCDPAGLADGPNIYRYVTRSPISCIDKKGTQTERQTAPKAPKTRPAPTFDLGTVFLFEDLSTVSVSKEEATFQDKNSLEFLKLSADTFASVLKASHGDVGEATTHFHSSVDFRAWLVKTIHDAFKDKGGNLSATNEVAGGKYNYHLSTQILARAGTLQCFYTSFFFQLKSLGLIPPEMTTTEFEKEYSNVFGKPSVHPVFSAGKVSFPDQAKSPATKVAVERFPVWATAIAQHSEWARFTGMSDRHFKAKALSGNSKEMIDRLESGETIHIGSAVWEHHVLATGKDLVDDPLFGRLAGAYKFEKSTETVALWAEP